MPRDSSGTYTLPEAAFVAGTVIRSSPVNSDFSDIATALTQSLATTGVSFMTGPVKLDAGSALAPSLTWATSLGTGWYRIADNEIGYAVNGVLAITYHATGNATFVGGITAGAGVFTNGVEVGNTNNVATDVLDWYEEGTFTPALEFGGASVGLTYTSRTGIFTRIGRVVYFDIEITVNSNGSSSGNASVSGLPYASAGSDYTVHFVLVDNFNGFDDSTDAIFGVFGRITSGASAVGLFLSVGQTEETEPITEAEIINGCIFSVSGFYFT